MRKFRDQMIFMRRLKRLIGRQEMDSARRLYAERPTYTLDHLIKERYPRFSDALGDLDDALSLVHLFATLPVTGALKAEHTAMARRLSLEWAHYVVRAHALKKVFFSVKGAFFQAEVRRLSSSHTFDVVYRSFSVLTQHRAMTPFLYPPPPTPPAPPHCACSIHRSRVCPSHGSFHGPFQRQCLVTLTST